MYNKPILLQFYFEGYQPPTLLTMTICLHKSTIKYNKLAFTKFCNKNKQ
jgi:hypothetical protein